VPRSEEIMSILHMIALAIALLLLAYLLFALFKPERF
jgi:K+-transporting ATPase KdpF subunit